MHTRLSKAMFKRLKRIAAGNKTAETKRMNMIERLEYLEDFRKYAVALSNAVTNHMTPTASNVHQDKAIEYWEAVQGIPAKLEIIDAAQIQPGKDGNHHKAAKYFRKIISEYRDIAETLTQISHDFDPAYISKNLHIPERFRNITKNPPVMMPHEIVTEFDRCLLVESRREYNRLKDYVPKRG